jgi:hypothetical protein
MAFKVLTHDYRPPVRAGDPVWDGETLPFDLPKVKLDTGADECAAGWNYTEDLSAAMRIAGLWPNGRPACCLVVEPSADAITRGRKSRCSQLTILRRCTDEEILGGIRGLPIDFADHKERMVESQHSWYRALGRPEHDDEIVEQGLTMALRARGLEWELRRFDGAWDAWNAWGEWGAWGARGAWNARDALTVEFVALQGWIEFDPLKFTTGIRDAYAAGLAVAFPVARDTLGWAMVEA